MHKQITVADRKVIEILLNEQYKASVIANKLGVDKSTICREINNRSTPN
ncbi:helix-turn-helix domain-containing protein, partial [Patescibacteria group bacterium]|nr:helix-turn-helix domain-containing protein [Patescibacteria group bacterium]